MGGIVTRSVSTAPDASSTASPVSPIVISSTAGKLSQGFCSHTYRRARNLNTEISRELSRKIIAFALQHGATVIVIEHDLDLIANVDYVIDLGPGGGEHGGAIIAIGTPSEVARNPASVTGPYLARTRP